MVSMITTILSPVPEAKRQSRRGFTLVEMMIAAGISALILTGIMTTFLHLGRSGARFQNYNDMEAQTRRTLELFAQDVRQASTVTWNSATSVTFTVNGLTVTYANSANNFTRQIGAGAVGNVISGLTPNTFQFRAFNLDGTELPLATAANRTAANSSTKQVQISMQAERSQQTLATATNTVLSARFILRNVIVTA